MIFCPAPQHFSDRPHFNKISGRSSEKILYILYSGGSGGKTIFRGTVPFKNIPTLISSEMNYYTNHKESEHDAGLLNKSITRVGDPLLMNLAGLAILANFQTKA